MKINTVNDNELIPAIVTLPGDIIKEELEARDWNQSDLAKIMDRPLQAINSIINGSRQITPETAIQLSQAFNTSPEFWLNLETGYRLSLAARTQINDHISRRSNLYLQAPVRDMIQRGWIENSSDSETLERNLFGFYRCSNMLELQQHICRGQESMQGHFRKSLKRQSDKHSLIAWLQRVMNLARNMAVDPFSKGKLHKAITTLRDHMETPADVTKVRDILTHTGVRFVIVPCLPSTYIDGAVMYIDDQRDQPVIAMTLRFDRIDNFWFTLMHELAHLYGEHTGQIIEILDEPNETKNEIEADKNAAVALVKEEEYRQFITLCRGRYSKSAVLSFAEKINRHPGIVVGRLHKDGMAYSNMRQYLVPVKQYLLDIIDK